MNYLKIVIYIIVTAIVLYGIDSINMMKIFKKNTYYSSRVFYIVIVISLAYLATNFIYDFLSLTM